MTAPALKPGVTVTVDGLRWALVEQCPPPWAPSRWRGVWRLSLLEECDPYPVGQVGFAHEDQIEVAR